jgi:hypothetical protein
MTTKLNTQDTIDVRDIIARFEELEKIRESYVEAIEDLESVADDTDADADERKAFADLEGARADLISWDNSPMGQELQTLTVLLADLEGNGGDEQWCDDWYPITLIRDSYFQTYAKELIEDCGDIPRDLPDYIEIDWQATAENIRVDYTPSEIDGVTYWYR